MDKDEKMFALVAQWRESGLTRRVFAQQHGITIKSFDYWCRKKSTPPAKTSSEQVGFIELAQKPVPREDHAHPKFEIELPGGVRIKIY